MRTASGSVGRRTVLRGASIGGLAVLMSVGGWLVGGRREGPDVSVDRFAEFGDRSVGLARPGPNERVVANVKGDGPARLVMLDRETLGQIGEDSIGSAGYAWWTVSPDGKYAVAAAGRLGDERLLVVDLDRFEKVGRIDLNKTMFGSTARGVWLSGSRLWLQYRLAYPPEFSGTTARRAPVERWRTRVVDVPGLSVESTTTSDVPTSMENTWGEERWATSRVVIGTRLNTIGSVTLARMEADGGVETVELERVTAGEVLHEGRAGGTSHTERVRPSLAVDPEGDRAFVVATGSPIAEVDLTTLGVEYHRVDGRPTLARSLPASLLPAAAAKDSPDPWGTSDDVRWLGRGELLVAGVTRSEDASNGRRHRDSRIVDTERWASRTLDRKLADYEVHGDLLIGVPATGGGEGGGIALYRPGGESLRQVLDGEKVRDVQVVDGKAFVTTVSASGGRDLFRVDLASGDTRQLAMLGPDRLTFRLLETPGVLDFGIGGR